MKTISENMWMVIKFYIFAAITLSGLLASVVYLSVAYLSEVEIAWLGITSVSTLFLGAVITAYYYPFYEEYSRQKTLDKFCKENGYDQIDWILKF